MNSNDSLKQELKKEATKYIENNKLDTILADMITSVLQSNTEKPIVHMVNNQIKQIKYLAALVPENDLSVEKIKIPKLTECESINN